MRCSVSENGPCLVSMCRNIRLTTFFRATGPNKIDSGSGRHQRIDIRRTKMYVEKGMNGTIFFFEVGKNLIQDVPDLESGSIESDRNRVRSF